MRHINKEFIQCINILDLKTVTALLENGVNVHIYDDYALRRSAERGRLDLVLKLLEYGADLHALNDYALRHSAKNGHADIVAALLERGANINPSTGVTSALKYSAWYNRPSMVTKLLEFGADVHVEDDAALRVSYEHRNLNVMTILLEHGANIYRANKIILEHLRINFDKEMADIVLPYCEPRDYEYFPNYYIREKIATIKSANKI